MKKYFSFDFICVTMSCTDGGQVITGAGTSKTMAYFSYNSRKTGKWKQLYGKISGG